MSFPKYPEYKDSGVEWLGVVPEHWRASALKYSYKIFGGSTPSSGASELWDGEIVWVTPTDLSKLKSFMIFSSLRTITDAGLVSCGTNLLPPGAIILSTRAPIGSLGIAGVELCTNQGCKGLVPQKGQHSRFGAYSLLVMAEELNVRGRGTTFLELSADALGAIELPSPPVAEQAAIVNFLDHQTARIDALVAEQQRLIELLKEKRQAVISHAVTKGLNPDVPLKDSGVEWLGEVPAHWEIKKIGVLYQLASERGEPDLPVLRVSIHHGVSDRELSEDEMDRKVTRIDDREKYQIVRPGDLVYNMMRAWQGGFGSVNVDGLVSPAYVVCRPLAESLSPYIEAMLRTPAAIEEMRTRSYGITDFRLRLYWDNFKTMRVPYPPLDERESIMNRLGEVISETSELEKEAGELVERLQERRSALISAAVTGKIDVRGWRPPPGSSSPTETTATEPA